jgi:hypothetical protein
MEQEYEIGVENSPNGYKHVMTPIDKERLKGNAKPKVSAFWLKNEIIIPVPTIHISTITENPEKFGLTTDYLKSKYEEHNEPYNHEGKARQEIIADLIKSGGWIRVRYTMKTDLWTLECGRLTNRVKDAILSFFMLLTGHDVGNQKAIDKMNSYSSVRINELHNNSSNMTSVKDILHMKGLFESAIPNHDVKFTLIENYNFRLYDMILDKLRD